MAQKGILGKTYRETMIMGWNTALEVLTKNKGEPESNVNSKFVPNFSFGENRPICPENSFWRNVSRDG